MRPGPFGRSWALFLKVSKGYDGCRGMPISGAGLEAGGENKMVDCTQQVLSEAQVLGALTLGGLLGMVGQGVRAVAGMKKLNDEAYSAGLSSADLFSGARLAVSLLIGFVTGVIATLSLGLCKLTEFDVNDVNLLLGISAAGYVGSDFIEAFTENLGRFRTAQTPDLEWAPTLLPGEGARTKTVIGRMSLFGGPDDTDMKPDEGLALMDESDIDRYPNLFLPQQPPGTSGLSRRLNPDSAYIACRWNYDETPRRHLKNVRVLVTNPENGEVAEAQPVDYGPKLTTGRVADLSPGLAEQLGLAIDQICKISIPLPIRSETEPHPQVVAAHPHILALDHIKNVFGTFEFQEASPRGAIRITDAWAGQNIIIVQIDELRHLVKDGKVECHKAIAGPLQAAIKEVARRNLLDRILKWDGLWVPRHKAWNPEQSLSSHSWGIAFDINAAWNAYGAEPAPKGALGSVVELAPIFESFGFAWGGLFRPNSARDGMHFEYCHATVQDQTTIARAVSVRTESLER
jgi:hypothetical protein